MDTHEVDEYGDTVAQTLFKIQIPDDMDSCTPNTYKGKVPPLPVLYSTPRMTTQNVKTSKHPRF